MYLGSETYDQKKRLNNQQSTYSLPASTRGIRPPWADNNDQPRVGNGCWLIPIRLRILLSLPSSMYYVILYYTIHHVYMCISRGEAAVSTRGKQDGAGKGRTETPGMLVCCRFLDPPAIFNPTTFTCGSDPHPPLCCAEMGKRGLSVLAGADAAAAR